MIEEFIKEIEEKAISTYQPAIIITQKDWDELKKKYSEVKE